MAAREPSTAAATFLNAFTKFWPVLRLFTPAMPTLTFVDSTCLAAAFASSCASWASILQVHGSVMIYHITCKHCADRNMATFMELGGAACVRWLDGAFHLA